MHYHKYRLIIPFLLPAVVLYSVFVLLPYVQAIYYSFTSWRGLSPNRPWVGLANYERLWNDERFHEALGRNAQLLVVLPAATLMIALTFAALFTQGGQAVKGSSFYRIVFFFPQVTSAVIIGILWKYIYDPRPSTGLLNGFLGTIGLDSLQRTWLGDAGLVLWSITAVAVWSSVGFYMVIFIASMQSIPTSFYEAAILDGAGKWRSFRDITFPLIWETIRTSVIYIAIIALDFFTLIAVMAGGTNTTPAQYAEVAAVYMYDMAYGSSRWGVASAVGVVLLILTLLLSVVLMRVTRRETYEY
jgi:N-acetylglucosamine transport system permease protein